MSRKGKNRKKFFHIGKNIPKNDKNRTPFNGEPNSYLDTYVKKDGRFFRRRKFGRNGRAYVDLDTPHDHNNKDHAHNIKGNERLADRPLTRKEKREMRKAKKKRRFWNNGK